MNLQFGQRIDEREGPSRGLIQPWFTHGALDEVQGWDLTDKVVLEWGGGHSTRWWASRCKEVWTVESDRHWYGEIAGWALPNAHLSLREKVSPEAFAEVPDGCCPDIVVIDGEYRTACLCAALTLPRPLVVIFDNWQQDYVFVDEGAEAMMRPYEGRFHVQADHRHHAGRPWQTAIWRLV